MKKLLSVLTAGTMALSLAACSNSSSTTGSSAAPESSTGSSAASATATTSSSGKRVTLAKENDVISMDTSYATDGMSFEMIAATVEGLETMDKAGNPIPGIAESYDISDDELTYTFHLRDANWDNGTPVTANDFVFAWEETVHNPSAEYSYLYTQDGACVQGADEIVYDQKEDGKLGIQAVDDKTFEVKLSKKCPYFVSLMTFPVFYPINEEFFKEQGDNYALTADGLLANGPYKLTDWTKGSSLTLDKNASYWDADNVKVDGIDVKIVPEASTSALDFESGNTDFTKLNSTLVDKYKDSESYTSYLEGYLWYLQFNYANEYLANANIRKALGTVIDRVDLVDNVLKDGSIAIGGFVPQDFAAGPDGKDYSEGAEKFFTAVGQDAVDAATKYWEDGLKELGKEGESVTLSLLYEPADPSKPAAEFIQSQLQKLPGLTIEMVSQEKENRIEKQKARDFDIVLTRWGPDYADPTTYLNLMLEGNSYNYGDYVNPAYDALITDAANAATPEERWEKLHEAEKLLMEDAPVVGVFQVGGASLVNPKVTGIESHSFGVPYIYKNLEKAD
ncbi:peptide ABC transporter substrate-binding protein [Erysipelotrichaceae bacterium RD49]|nr:peptide ABC transporter substrate-binding protein [Erysipelotrichaceae bacterium RD49]